MQKTQRIQGFFSLYDYSTEKILSVLVTRRSISGFYDKKLNIKQQFYTDFLLYIRETNQVFIWLRTINISTEHFKDLIPINNTCIIAIINVYKFQHSCLLTMETVNIMVSVYRSSETYPILTQSSKDGDLYRNSSQPFNIVARFLIVHDCWNPGYASAVNLHKCRCTKLYWLH